MAYALVTLFLFCFSLLPSAYLRYYPFRSIVPSPTRHVLLCGHLLMSPTGDPAGVFFINCLE